MASIAEILLAQGEQAARARRARGGAWTPVVQQLANLPAQISDDRKADAERAQLAQMRGQQLQLGGQRLQQGQQELQASTQERLLAGQMAEVLNTPGIIKSDGSFDLDKAQGVAQSKGYQTLAPGLIHYAQQHDSEVGKQLLQRAQTGAAERANQPKPVDKKTREVKVRNPDGTESIQIVEDTPGQTFTSTPAPTKVTFGNLSPVMAGGKRTLVRTGSDGKLYDLKGSVVTADVSPDVPPSTAQGPQPSWQWVVRDGKEVYTNRVKDGDKPQNARVKATEDERKSAGFYSQMKDAIGVIDELQDKLTTKELYQIQTLPQEKLIGMLNRNALSEHAKRYLRAFEQFTESRLRAVSGAAIADTEYARDRRTYAKQYGETPNIQTDRQRARVGALDALKKRAGVALDDADASAEDAYAEYLKRQGGTK